MIRVILCMCALGSLAGCGTIRQTMMPAEDDLLSGAGSIIQTQNSATKFEQIDLTGLLESYGIGDMKSISADLNSEKYRYLRNDMQDRILAASNQRCGYYLRQLVASKSQTKMGWGSLALLLSGAASVTHPIASAQVLAAGSAVATGVNTLYDEAYFNNLAVNVIAGGISKQREGLLIQMTDQRKKTMADYPVNRAVADAISYHAACNIVTGLEAAANAIKIAPAAATTDGTPGTAPAIANAAGAPVAPAAADVAGATNAAAQAAIPAAPAVVAPPTVPAAPVVPPAPKPAVPNKPAIVAKPADGATVKANTNATTALTDAVKSINQQVINNNSSQAPAQKIAVPFGVAPQSQ